MHQMAIVGWIKGGATAWFRLALLGIAAAVVTACEPGIEAEQVLRIGILPDQSEEALRTQYGPLFEHLAEVTGLRTELVIPTDYDDLLSLFHDGDVDLAYFGGLTFLKASAQDGAIPLVMRDVDAVFTSYFLVNPDDLAESLEDLGGQSLGFGSRLSTSGHLMPRHYLTGKGLFPEEFFSAVAYSGAHDKTAYMVRDGEVDVGVANSQVIDAMIADGRLNPDEIRILWRTPPFADYVWAVRSDVSRETRDSVREGFLSLSIEDQVARGILESVGATQFLPATQEDFRTLSAIATQFGLL